MEMAAPGQEKAASKLDIFNDEAQGLLKRWSALAKGVSYLPPVAVPAVPTRIVAKGSVETIDADHGSFDNSLDSFNRAVENILQKAPLRAATDLTGF
jgi:hypothetical protein